MTKKDIHIISEVFRNCIEIERKRSEHYGNDEGLKAIHSVVAVMAHALANTPTKILDINNFLTACGIPQKK